MTGFSFLFLLSFLALIVGTLIKQGITRKKLRINKNRKLKILYFIKITILFLTCIFVSLTFSNFKYGIKKINNYSTQIDNIIILDYSTSMIANDIKPTRFDQAKNLANYLIENLANSRFAIIIFGDEPFLEVPFTDNLKLLKDVISSISINEEYYRSSNIASALYSAIYLFNSSPAFYKNIILISDFDFNELLSKKVKETIKDNISFLYSIVISSENGSNIWLSDKKTFLQDRFQNTVFSSPNITFLEDISKLTNSILVYWNSLNYSSLSSIINSNKSLSLKMEKHETFIPRKLNYIFGIISSFFIILYLFISSNLFFNFFDNLYYNYYKE